MNIKIPTGTERLYLEKLVDVLTDEISGLMQDRSSLSSALKIYNDLEVEQNKRLDEANKEIMEKEIEIKHLKRELNQAKKKKAKTKPSVLEKVTSAVPIEEVTIPTAEELQKMPKAKLVQAAKQLGFEYDMKLAKHLMIEKFEKDTESFIEDLKQEGAFVNLQEEDMDGGTY